MTTTPSGFTEQDANNRPDEASAIWAVDSAIDANGIVHVLANTQNGPVVYYTFNTNTNTWGNRIEVSNSEWLNDGGIQQGTTSIALVLDSSGVAHVVYIKKVNGFRRVYYNNNQGGSWNHEVLLDNQATKHNFHATLAFGNDGALYAAWFSNLVDQAGSIHVRIRKNGSWQANITEIGNGAWGAGNYALDQGPSLIVTPNGNVHIAYIYGYEAVPNSPSGYEYGRVKHFYSTNGGTSWITDDPPTRYSHSPSLATDANGTLYIFGHREQWKVEHCADMYVVAKAAGGSWGSWRILDQGCLDSSVTTKWSQYNWNSSQVLDFLYWTEHGPDNQSDYNQLFYGEIRGGVSAINTLPVAPAP